MAVDPRDNRRLGITAPVGYGPTRRDPLMPGREIPPAAYAPTLPFRGRWLKPFGVELKGGAEPVLVLPDNPKRYGAYLFNAGGQIELSIPMPGGAGRDQATGAVLPTGANSVFLDSGSVQVPNYALSSYKALYIVVDVAITKSGAVQSTVQLLVGRQPWPPANGATTQIGAGNNLDFVSTKGATQNFGGAAASIARGIYVLSPADIADLQWPHPYIGLEFNAGGAQTLSAGVARLLMQITGGPMIAIGEDNSVNPALTGQRRNATLLPAQGSPILWQGDGELWAAATPGGQCELVVQEIHYSQPNQAFQQT